MNHFELLGVPPDASDHEIAAAYRRLARQLHPDTKPDATPEETARLTEAMARLNEAWSVLKDPETRARYRQDLDAPQPHEPVVRMPRADECQMCGYHPAREFRFQYQRAWVLAASVWSTEARVCRDCALALGRSSQNRTLWTGWFGLIAFFRNLAIVATNAKGLWSAGRLAAPRARPGEIFTPFIRPLPPGKSVWARSGVWVVVVAVILLGGLGAGTETERTTPASRPPFTISDAPPLPTTRPTSRGATWRVGSCVSRGTWVSPVPCSQPNGGEIIGRASSPAGCPARATSYVEIGLTVWCIA